LPIPLLLLLVVRVAAAAAAHRISVMLLVVLMVVVLLVDVEVVAAKATVGTDGRTLLLSSLVVLVPGLIPIQWPVAVIPRLY
jgi:hypothetical protein